MGQSEPDALVAPDTVTVVEPTDPPTANSQRGGPWPDVRRVPASDLDGDRHRDVLRETDLAIVRSDRFLAENVNTLGSRGVSAVVVSAAVDTAEWGAVRSAATASSVTILGPNAGIALPEKTPSYGLDTDVRTGSIAVVGTDAPLVSAVVDEAENRGLGVSIAIATGDASSVGVGPVLYAASKRDRTRVVLTQPASLDRSDYAELRALNPEIPLVATAPRRAAGDATVALPADGTISPIMLRDAIVQQSGGLVVDSIERSLDLAPVLADQPLPDGNDVVIVSNAGGPGVMATDAVGASGLTMANFQEKTVEALEAVIPDQAVPRNPLDLLADADLDVIRSVLDITLDDPGVQGAVVISAPHPIVTFDELAAVVTAARSRHDKPIVTALMGGDRVEPVANRLRSVGVSNHFDPYQAVAILEGLARHRDAAAKRTTEGPDRPDAPWEAVGEQAGRNADPLSLLATVGLEVDTGKAMQDARSVSVSIVTTDRLGPVIAVSIDEYGTIVNDVAIRIAPPSATDVEEMLSELRARPLLDGARGGDAVDLSALIDTIRRIGSFALQADGLREMSVELSASDSGITVDSARAAWRDHQ